MQSYGEVYFTVLMNIQKFKYILLTILDRLVVKKLPIYQYLDMVLVIHSELKVEFFKKVKLVLF